MVPGAAPPEKSTGGGDFAAAGDPSTTTISTIAVRAGVNASIVVALLKSAGYIELRVDEMRPKLLAIGNSAEETSGLLHIHEDLLARLREKDDQVQALLSRADSLSGEKKDPKEAVVYEEMAKSMHQAWRSLNRQLILRSYLLRETLHFHQMAESHELLTSKTAQILGQLNALNGEKLVPAIDQLINDIIDTTAAAVELGTSVISQIRTLGQIDDNPERPKEILEACVLVETIMLRIATEWEKAESSWQKARQQPLHATTTEIDELTIIEQWLTYSEKRLKALNDSGQKQILNEGNKHVARLRDLSTSQSEADTGRISHLSGRIEEFLHYLKTRMNRSQRIQAFIQAAKSMLSQLSMMAADMKNASAAISGELAPLAKQKALPLISEGKDIAAKEVLNYEEQRLVRQLCEDLERGLEEIEQLSKQRHASQQVNQEIQDIRSWLDGQATAFLAQRGDMGGNLTDAREFVAVHKNFATDVINRDASVMTIHAKRSQMTSDDEKFLEVFIKDYEKMKDVLENRIQLGTTYEQVHKFAKELEGSFDALQTLLENNQEFTNEKIAAQIANVFQMIQETLSQEKHQGEKFISNATQIGKGDEWLNVERAQEAIRNLITDHENRFKYVSHKWNEWQRNKNSETTVERTIEEIQMWQEDVLEYVAKIDRSSFTTKQESEQAHQKLQAFREAAAEHSKRLDTLKTETNNDEQLSRISVTVDKQDYIKNRIEEVLNKLELRTLLRVIEDVQIWQEEAIEIIRSVDHVVSTTNTTDQQIHELRRRVEELNDETIKKSQFLEESKSLSQNEIFQRELQETITRQEQIKQTIEQLDSKLEVTNLVKIVEEVQMWQEEMIEIIRLVASTRPSSAQESREVVEKIQDMKESIEMKADKIVELKKMSSVPAFVERIVNVEERQKVIKNLVQELEQKFEELTLNKTTEEIQMWQEEMIEIIRLLDSTPMQSVQESKELQEKVEMVKKSIETQQPRIDEVVEKVTDERWRTQISQIVDRQQNIRQMADKLEQKAKSVTVDLHYQQPSSTVEQTKTVDLTSFEKTEITLTPEEKQELQTLKRIIEEIQMWQEEMIEIIRLIEKSPPRTIQESDDQIRRVTEIQNTVEEQTDRIQQAKKFTKDETFIEVVEDTVQRQQLIQQLVRELNERAVTQNQVFHQKETRKNVQAPQILTQLRDAEVDEGSRFEFTARIEGEPEPVITWLKDGIDVKSNIDYRQEFINGVASLVIEESFIEDTATYTVRAVNEGGKAENSARLIVKSRSALSSTIADEDKPRFVKQLQNVQINEGQTAHLDCVVIGKPEPEVVWYKEQTSVIEDERIHLRYTGDHCQMIIDQTVPQDTGMYTVKAKNVHGEVANFCQLKVAPKKQAPPTAPKPVSRPQSILKKSPSIQPALTNTTWQEGETATLQVYTQGEPRPSVHWRFNETPVTTSDQIYITEKEDGWSKLTIERIEPIHAGMYTVIAENEVGEAVTGATVHVQPSFQRSTTTENYLQEDVNERIGQPVQLTTITKSSSEYETKEKVPFPQPRTPASITEDKRWVEVIQEHFEEHMSQPSPVMSPIPQVTERRKIESEQRWVDKIDEILAPRQQPVVEVKETKTTTGEEHWSSHRVHEPSPKPHTFTTSQTTTNVSHISQSHVPIQPDIQHTTTTSESVKTMNIAKIRQSPQPEVHEARTTPGPTSEHAATIRKTPVREMQQATLTKAPSLENVAKIRQSPVPESHRSVITRRSPSVENIAKIQPATQQPEAYTATTSGAQPVGNIAKIHVPNEPERYGTLRTAPKIDRIDDIVEIPPEELVKRTIRTTTEITTDADQNKQEIAQREPQTSRTVTETISGEGWVQHMHQDLSAPETSTVTVKRLDVDESSHIHQQNQQAQPQTRVSTTKTEEEETRNLESRIPIRQEPKTTKTVTETTSGEGWVQQVHQDLVNPQNSTVTVKRLDIEEDERRRIEQQLAQPQPQTRVSTTKTEEEETRNVESRIPIRQEPKTTKTVTETTSGEGWVQQVHQDLVNPQNSTVTVKRLDIEEDERRRIEQQRAQPKTTKTVTETTSGEGWVQQVHQDLVNPQNSTVTVKRLDIEEDERRRIEIARQQQLQLEKRLREQELEEYELRKESRIPVKREPKTSKTVTETVSGEGWVQQVHQDLRNPQNSTVTVKRLGIDEEERIRNQQIRQPTQEHTSRQEQHEQIEMRKDSKIPLKKEPRPISMDSSVRQRDSFVLASDVEGFWTDGAYTASPTPPPVPPHRTTAEDNMQRIGLSRTTTEPEFIKAFQREYTVEEGGRLVIECVLVGNPKPKTRFFFNDKLITEKTEFCKITNVNDTYLVTIQPARLEHAGYYKVIAENKRGVTESLSVVHVRPRALQQYQVKREPKPIVPRPKPAEHTVVEEEFAMFEYEQRRPLKHESSKLTTPPPAKKLQQTHRSDEEHLEQYDIEGKKSTGHPPHFTQTLTSTVAASGENSRFEGVVTGWPAPTVEWTVDGKPIDLPDVKISNIGGRVSLNFTNCQLAHSGKYMCTAKNGSGVATSSAQLVVRPKTVAPDFIQRLISEEVEEGTQLKWTVKVTGDPMPTLTWLRDGYEIPDCEEIRLLDEGNGVYSLLILRVEAADSGQFTCLAENIAGEARSTADLVVRPSGTQPGNYFHVTKVTQERQAKGTEPVRTSAFSIENPRQSEML